VVLRKVPRSKKKYLSILSESKTVFNEVGNIKGVIAIKDVNRPIRFIGIPVHSKLTKMVGNH
jgi:hypothetical protein